MEEREEKCLHNGKVRKLLWMGGGILKNSSANTVLQQKQKKGGSTSNNRTTTSHQVILAVVDGRAPAHSLRSPTYLTSPRFFACFIAALFGRRSTRCIGRRQSSVQTSNANTLKIYFTSRMPICYELPGGYQTVPFLRSSTYEGPPVTLFAVGW